MRSVLDWLRPAGWVLAVFILANSAGELLFRGFAADHLWIRSAQLVPGWRLAALALAAVLLLPAAWLWRRPWTGTAALTLAVLFALAAAADAGRFYLLLVRGDIRTPALVPFSTAVVLVLLAAALRIRRAGAGEIPPSTPRRRRLWCDLAAGAVFAVAGMIALIFTYGPTNYAQPADCAVVLGSRAYADGTPSLALFDRTMAGIDLYRRGLVGKIVMSGAVDHGAGGVSEPLVMRRLALEAGVPDEDIVIDEEGVDSWATVRNTRRLAEQRGWRQVLLVSHYFHLPRLRLAADRAGLCARTVPCRQTRRLVREPYSIARECAGLGYYYLLHLPQG